MGVIGFALLVSRFPGHTSFCARLDSWPGPQLDGACLVCVFRQHIPSPGVPTSAAAVQRPLSFALRPRLLLLATGARVADLAQGTFLDFVDYADGILD